MNQSGIQVPDEVKQAFASARTDDNVRWLKIVISGEEMKLDGKRELTDSFENDYDALAGSVEDREAAYFVFRLDVKNELGYRWLLISHVPENAKVRHKMLYSSTLATLKRELGNAYFAGDYHTTTKEELTFAGYNWESKSDRLESQWREYMTEKERQLEEERSMSIEGHVGPTTTNVHGVNFPATEETKEKLKSLAEGQLNFVSLKITDNEELGIDVAQDNVEPEDMAKIVPNDEPRFIFYIYRHKFEERDCNSNFFIYYCPTKSKIKKRMIYSSSKNSAFTQAGEAGFAAEKSIEVSDTADITSSYLYDYVHPVKIDPNAQKFKKPKRPGKGRARITK